jgi:hypothetical protein
MPTHKWRLRPPHPCENSECRKEHNRSGRYCGKCQKRLDRHGTLSIIENPPKICDTPACHCVARRNGHCHRCDLLWKRGIDPDTFRRRYHRLCKVRWCSDYAKANEFCDLHGKRYALTGSVLTAHGKTEEVPTTCTWPKCADPIHARGLCLVHLTEKSRSIMLLREFLPVLPGHKIRTCIGKPKCRRNAILFGRCPDCLYDWQFSLKPKRNFFKRPV